MEQEIQTIGQIMTSIPEKKDGSNLTREDLENKEAESLFVKKEKFCEFCGKELEQRYWRANGVIKYFPAWQECDCEQAQAEKHREIEERENQERQAKLAEAEERRNKKIKKLLGESGMTPRAQNCQFAGYQLNIANENAFRICKNYSENFNQLKNKARNGLFLAGPCGVGKSHLAFSIANSLINKGKSVISMTMIDLLMNIKNSYSIEKMTEKEILKIYEDCSLLVIDDLGKEKPTEWALQMIYTIIDRRYNALKPIVVTTNYTASDLIERLTIGKDASSSAAIVDRLYEMCEYVPIEGISFRRK